MAKKYQPPVKAPEPRQILSVPKIRLNYYLQMLIQTGPELTTNGNRFIGYAIDTLNHEMVNDAYLKIRLIHPEARHIMCVYDVPCENDWERSGACEDGEAGSGRTLLRVLKDNNITQHAIFIVRYCGEKLGPKRFQYIKEVAEGTIRMNPFNSATQKNQYILDDYQDVSRGNEEAQQSQDGEPDQSVQTTPHRPVQGQGSRSRGRSYSNAAKRGNLSHSRVRRNQYRPGQRGSRYYNYQPKSYRGQGNKRQYSSPENDAASKRFQFSRPTAVNTRYR